MDLLDRLESRGLSRVFSNTTVQKHQFFRAQPILNHMVSSTHTFFLDEHIVQFSSVAQSCPTLCDPMDCRGPHGHAHQASLSIANSWSSLKLTSIEPVMPSSHPILCHPLLLMPSIFPRIRVFSNGSAIHIRWPKYWNFSFNISPSHEHPGLISFRMDWLDLLAVQGTLYKLKLLFLRLCHS